MTACWFRVLRLMSCVLAFVVLASCGTHDGRWRRDAWREQAERACIASKQVVQTPYIRRDRPIRERSACGLTRPFKVTALANGHVAFDETATLSCSMIPALERWVAYSVQPTALALYGSPVRELDLMGSYNCRARNGKKGGKISEHAFANALDVGGFTLADGRKVRVKSGWNGAMEDAIFLRQTHRGACREFTTVIGPDGDRAHADHLHLDLARHGKSHTSRYCR
jgi:hypothetical protein